MPQEADKRGYLLEDFRLFHLKDSLAQQMEYHYHEFDKLILLLGGRVDYLCEGQAYFLQPGDVLLVRHGLIHRPVIHPGEPYERVVLWLGPEWLRRRSDPAAPLSCCFDLAEERGFRLLRSEPEQWLRSLRLVQELEEALRSREFGHVQQADLCCQQLLLAVNRDFLSSRTAQDQPGLCRSDPKIEELLRFIAHHLDEELTVDTLAARLYLSRSYLMHRFKAATGYTIHQYVTQKRLLRAGELIRSGVPVLQAAEQTGFRDYSTFLRAFRRLFGTSPRALGAAGEEPPPPAKEKP
jgi:AraC-like DNA-binding protein